MNSYHNKQDKCLKNLVPPPICLGCEPEFETWDYILFECKRFEKTRKAINIKKWNDVWVDKRGIAQKYLVA